MYSANPFAEFRCQCEKAIAIGAKVAFPQCNIEVFNLSKPSNFNYGHLASSICFALAKDLKRKPPELSTQLVNAIDKSKFNLISKVEVLGGYVNFYLDFPKFSALTFNSIRHFGNEYGFVKTEHPVKTIVEHTSVNPLHPIHIGQARNPMLGDALAKILKCRGHQVFRHYYIDDVGRQSSVVAYGYIKLGKPVPDEKADHFLGKIYTITCCLVELNRLRRLIGSAKDSETSEDVAKLNKDLDDWVSIAAELEQKHPQLFESLSNKISEDANPEEQINELNRAYESGEPYAKSIVREVSNLCLSGFRKTQERVGVFYDSWDWESDFVWNQKVTEALRLLEESGYVCFREGVLEFDAEKVVKTLNLTKPLGLSADHNLSPLTLLRADGTTLYTTRDVAYTLWKFCRADRVINVIGMEQSLAQLQLKIALYALNFDKYAENFVHFAYNLVTLPGYKMSSRRGHYITFDEVLDEAVERAFQEVSKRSPELEDEEKRRIATFVGIGAVRYSLVDVDPAKPVVFTWDRVLNFETNSAPYVQYTHARACSILRKAETKSEGLEYSLLNNKIEQELILSLGCFPDLFVEAAEYLKPSMFADYSNAIADKFNTFYNALPVLKAESHELSQVRLALTESTVTVLHNALSLIGVVAPERM